MSMGSDDRVVLKDGRIVLYKRDGIKNPKWQARISVPKSKGYKIVSTKSVDLDDAKRFAGELYDELYSRVRDGGSIQSKTFKQVFEEWEKHVTTMGHTTRGGSWDGTIHRIKSHALKFFGSMRMENIGSPEFTQFWQLRKESSSKKVPTNGTLRRERTSIMPVFKYALSKGYISKLPDTNPPKAKSERRPTFSDAEWRLIMTKMKGWIVEGQKLATARDRIVAAHYFVILANTGLRVGELRDLRWNDLWQVEEADGSYQVGRASGKTGKREFIFQPGSEASIKVLYNLRCKELRKTHPKQQDLVPEIDGLVICHPDGSPIGSLKRSFQSLLKFAGVPQWDKHGVNRTIYSLRHFYATRRLSSETNAYLVAKQMGTSVEMLEKHYGQTVTSTLAQQITKSKPLKIDVEMISDPPF